MKTKTSMRIQTAFLAATLVVGAAAVWGQEDYGTWTSMRTITVNTAATGGGASVTGAVTGFPVLVRLTSAQTDVFTQAKTGGADIRFFRGPGQRLPYQIERWDSAAREADIWVRLDSVRGNGSTPFNMYWGKSSAADSSRGARVFDTAGGYQGVWHFNGTLNDASINAINGTDEGTADAAGAVGRGRSFSGTSRIMLGNHAKMSSGDADRFTVESWVNWTSIGTGSSDRYRCIINHGTTNNADQFFMYARNPSSGGVDPYYAVGYYTGSTSNNAAQTGIASDAATWVHITGTYDGTEWRVYRNGVLGATAAKDGSPVNAAADWIIGAWGTSRYFLGSMDEVRFSNRVRSADWIKLAYETQKSGATALSIGATAPAGVQAGAPALADGFAVEIGASGVLFRLPAGSGRAALSVTDMQGRLLWSREAELSASGTTVARAALPAGRYAARLSLRDGGNAERTFSQAFTIAP